MYIGCIADPDSLSDEGLSKLVEELVFEREEIGCSFCGELKPVSSFKGYAYSDSICSECWDNCPECGQCDEWIRQSSKSTRKNDYKKCGNCGKKLVTRPATG